MKKAEDAFIHIASNRRARHEYIIESTVEAGLVLQGPEVKSLRLKQCVINSAFAKIEPQGAFLCGMKISPYAFNTSVQSDSLRIRKLLLKKTELKRLAKLVEIKGMALPALEIYFKRGWAKVLLGIGKGKNAADKKEAIKKRDLARELRRDFSNKYKG